MRSTSVPPKKEATNESAVTAPAMPVLAGLPVVCRTNHGMAIVVKRLATVETTLAPRSATRGIRLRGSRAAAVCPIISSHLSHDPATITGHTIYEEGRTRDSCGPL